MINLNPNSKKGGDTISNMKRLMGNMKSLHEGVNKSTVGITKIGPDNIVYGIVKEGTKYYIKTTDKLENIKAKDFKYIGGLANKNNNVHESYSEATKMLNLKMLSLKEAYGSDEVIDVLKDDKFYINENVEVTEEDNEYEEETIEEGELKVGKVAKPEHELEGTTYGDYEEVTTEPDDAPNDNSTGTVKDITESKKKNPYSILKSLDTYESILESVLKKKD